jgi:hypothetical protein
MRVASAVAVHCFPSADEEFRAAASQLVADSFERIRSTDELIATVQVALRERYPEAIVRSRDPQAEVGISAVQTLYAFRDGRAA